MATAPSHEIYHSSTNSISLTFTGGELKIKESNLSSGYAVRVLEAGRIGFGYCQNKNDLDSAFQQAKKLSKFSVKSSFSFAPKSNFKKLKIFDPTLDEQDYDLLYSFVDETKNAAESLGGKSRVILSCESSFVEIENSEGFFGNYKKTDLSVYVECMHDDGFGFAYLTANRKPSRPSISDLGLKAAEMAKDMRGAKKPPSGTYSVVMELEGLENILEILMPSFSGDWKRRDISKLSIGKKFSSQLTICENGLASGTNARPFDDEGIPSEQRFLVKDGVVKSFLYDCETAALAKKNESGACTRSGYDQPPAIEQSNLVISPGTWNDLSELDRYLEVHSGHGSHTANVTTGDFGLEVSVAFLVDKGKRIPVRGLMITGNVFDLLSKIEAMERDVRSVGGLIAPRIAFKDVQVVS